MLQIEWIIFTWIVLQKKLKKKLELCEQNLLAVCCLFFIHFYRHFFLYLFECYNMIVNAIVVVVVVVIYHHNIHYVHGQEYRNERKKKTEISNSLERKKNLKKTLWVCIIHFQQTHKLIEYKRKKSVRDIFITMCFGTRRINKKKKKMKNSETRLQRWGNTNGKITFYFVLLKTLIYGKPWNQTVTN